MKSYSKKKMLQILNECLCQKDQVITYKTDNIYDEGWYTNSSCDDCKYNHRTDCHLLRLFDKLVEHDVIKIRKTKNDIDIESIDYDEV